MDIIEKTLLEAIADLHEMPAGAFNLRINGKSSARNETANIDISTKDDKPGIDIVVKPGTQNESVHIPVILSLSGVQETVYNDFYIGDNCNITIVAGCGIHNSGDQDSRHDGVHAFHIGKNSKVRYVEKHYGSGDGNGERIMNPTTLIDLDENSYLELETTQIRGVDSTKRITNAKVGVNATLVIKEKLMTHGRQNAESEFTVDLDGEDSGVSLVSRSVAKDSSSQLFVSRIHGNNKCNGHSECDAIIMDNAKIGAVPEITASHLEASLIHEAAIGKIAGEQIIKLMSMGLTEQEAEEQIINGFLR